MDHTRVIIFIATRIQGGWHSAPRGLSGAHSARRAFGGTRIRRHAHSAQRPRSGSGNRGRRARLQAARAVLAPCCRWEAEFHACPFRAGKDRRGAVLPGTHHQRRHGVHSLAGSGVDPLSTPREKPAGTVLRILATRSGPRPLSPVCRHQRSPCQTRTCPPP
jgi:hypothetical protein